MDLLRSGAQELGRSGRPVPGRQDRDGAAHAHAEANLANALVNSFELRADRDLELNERFNAWLAQ